MDVHSRAKCSNLILRIAYQRFFSSSFIQTILSALESSADQNHQINAFTLAGFTAGRDSLTRSSFCSDHPALKISLLFLHI